MARLLTLTLSVLTFSFGLPRTENQGFSFSEGNFNVLTVRQVYTAISRTVPKLPNASAALIFPTKNHICFASSPSRMTCLAAICLTQAWMMWKFINFQLKKWREHSQNQASKKKTVSPKSKPHKRDPQRGESSCAAVFIVHLRVVWRSSNFVSYTVFLSSSPFCHQAALPTES